MLAGCGRGLRLGCGAVHSAVRGSCRAPRLRLRGLCRALATTLPRCRALRSQMKTGAVPLVYVQVQVRALWSQRRVHSLNISSWQQRPSLPLAHQSLVNKTLSLLCLFSPPSPCSLPFSSQSLDSFASMRISSSASHCASIGVPFRSNARPSRYSLHPTHQRSLLSSSQQRPRLSATTVRLDSQRLGGVAVDLGGVELVQSRPLVGGPHSE